MHDHNFSVTGARRIPYRYMADFAIASVLTGLTLPLLGLVALAIKWEGAGPVFEKRVCIGRGGCRFRMLKFRTTVHDPKQTTPTWARKSTRMGHFFRYTGIEALPTLINVLRGEISMLEALSLHFRDIG